MNADRSLYLWCMPEKFFLQFTLGSLLLLVFASSSIAGERVITLYYTTDLHGHIITNEQTVGLDRISSVLKQTPDALLVDGGDFLTSTTSTTLRSVPQSQDRRLSAIIGSVGIDFFGSKELPRSGEAALGNLCADALRAAYDDDIAIVNDGFLRDSLKKGPVTRKDIMNALPFVDLAVSIELTGQEIVDLLNHGFSKYPAKDEAFPQISNLIVHTKMSNPPGSRVISIFLGNGAPLDMKKSYTVCVTGFMASGGDGYPHLAGKRRLKAFKFAEETFIQYIQTHDTSEYGEQKPSRLILQ